jgi:predicted  nucleic acid-binding Zn-ribbon protein
MQVTSLVSSLQQLVKAQGDLERASASSQQAAAARADSDARALQRLQQELTTAIADTAAAQDQLQVTQSELQRVREQVRCCRAVLASVVMA